MEFSAFIASVKLRELRRQRARLLRQYDDLERRVVGGSSDASASAVERLENLREGLSKICLGGVPMYAVEDLSILFSCPTASSVSYGDDALLRGWIEHFLTVLRQGRRRTDAAACFGVWLSQWASRGGGIRPVTSIESIGRPVAPEVAGDAGDVGDAYWDTLFSIGSDAARAIGETIENRLTHDEISPHETVRVVDVGEPDAQSPEVLRQFRELKRDDTAAEELGRAIRLSLPSPIDDRWGDEPIDFAWHWTGNRDRPFPHRDLIRLASSEFQMRRLCDAISSAFGSVAETINRHQRLAKLIDLGTPEVILMNERRMFDDAVNRTVVPWYEPIDPWTGQSFASVSVPPTKSTDRRGSENRIAEITARRAALQMELRESGLQGGYYRDGGNAFLQLWGAEVRSLRAAYPDRPLCVLSMDFADYFASVDHAVIDRMLTQMRVPRSVRRTLMGQLSMPIRFGGRVVTLNRGLPLGTTVSHWAAEWLMRMMEVAVQREARVRIIRRLDDVVVLAADADAAGRAWDAVERFAAATGLNLNRDKCGSVSIGGDGSPVQAKVNGDEPLPSALPQFGPVRLDADGEFSIDAVWIDRFLETSRQRIRAATSVLESVRRYNVQLRYLMNVAGLGVNLGSRHRVGIHAAMMRFESEIFEGGIERHVAERSATSLRTDEAIDHEVREAETDVSDGSLGIGETRLPAALWYWPVTAGGLGLESARIWSGMYNAAVEAAEPLSAPEPTEHWQSRDAWTQFYDRCHAIIEPRECVMTRENQRQRDDFIKRGKKLTGGNQSSLGPYWSWVLVLYGPEILRHFGTHDFLLTDLVPTRLIRDNLASSAG